MRTLQEDRGIKGGWWEILRLTELLMPLTALEQAQGELRG